MRNWGFPLSCRHSVSISRTGAAWTAGWSILLHTYSALPNTDKSLMQQLANKRGKYALSKPCRLCCIVAIWQYHKLVATCRFRAAWLDYISLHATDFKHLLRCICEGKHWVPTRMPGRTRHHAWLPSPAGGVGCVSCNQTNVASTPSS